MLKILIPVAESKASPYAIQHVIHRVWTGEALDVHLLHVRRRWSRYLGRLPGRGDGDDARRVAGAFAEPTRLLERGGLRFQTHVRTGDPALEIVRFAQTNGCGGIVMASNGMGSVSEMLFGSVTAKVLRTSRIPVEVVPAAPRSRLRAYAGPAGVGAGFGALLYIALD